MVAIPRREAIEMKRMPRKTLEETEKIMTTEMKKMAMAARI